MNSIMLPVPLAFFMQASRVYCALEHFAWQSVNMQGNPQASGHKSQAQRPAHRTTWRPDGQHNVGQIWWTFWQHVGQIGQQPSPGGRAPFSPTGPIKAGPCPICQYSFSAHFPASRSSSDCCSVKFKWGTGKVGTCVWGQSFLLPFLYVTGTDLNNLKCQDIQYTIR